MTRSLTTALLALAIVPLVGRAADEPNPYKDVKVGDFATYKLKATVSTTTIEGTATQLVVARTDKDVKVRITASASGMDAPVQEQTIDLTKPYDPTKVGTLPPGTEATTTKGEEGKEKVKVGDKEYETTWTTYKIKAKASGQEIDGTVKVWMAKDVPMGVVKMEMTATVAKSDMKMWMELTGSGTGKKP